MDRVATTREGAQRRADRIQEFRAELEQLQGDGALELTESQRQGLRAYHDDLLAQLRRSFDVDTSTSHRQMSWGMRIASTLGALALGAALYFFFFRFWGLMATPLQVAVLVAAPLGALLGVEACSRRERTGYFTGLLAVVALAAFITDISMLGATFNVVPSSGALLLWGAFALALAYAYRLRLILAAGIVLLLGFVTVNLGSWTGAHWLTVAGRPENFLAAGLIAFTVPLVLRHRDHQTFPPVYRALGLLAAFLAVFILAGWGRASYLPMAESAVEILYQAGGFLLAGGFVWIGIRRGWRETANVAMGFFVIFLYARFFDWWWELMPRYLFFLVLGLVAVGLLVVLRKLRSAVREA